MVIRTLALVFFAALIGSGSCQKRTKIGTSIAGSEFQVPAVDFECPEEFGYYPSGTDCTRYYVCVFGGALLESCSGGLVYSHELQTCDWPRNVDCAATQAAALPVKSSNSRTSSPINQFITSDKAPITSFATGRPSKELATPVSFQDFEKDVVTKSDRQGKAFEEESAPSFNPNRNSNFRSTFFEDEDSIEEDFVPATTFNPASRFNKRPTSQQQRLPTSTVFNRHNTHRVSDTRKRTHDSASQDEDIIPSMHFTSSGSTRRFPPTFAFERPLGAVPVRGADPPHIRVKQSIQADPHITTDEQFYSSQFKRPHIPANNRFHNSPRYTDNDANIPLRNPTTGQFPDHTRNRNTNDNHFLRNPVTGQFYDDLRYTDTDLRNPAAEFFEDSHKSVHRPFKSHVSPNSNPFIQAPNTNTHTNRNIQQSVRKPQVEQLSDYSDELPTGWMVHQQRPRPAIAKPQQADQFRVSQSPFAPAPIRPTPTTQRSTDLDFFQFQEEKEEIRAPISENPTTPAIDYYDESIEYEDLLEDFVTDRNRPVDTFYEDYDQPASAERTTQSPVTIRRTTTARPTTTTTRTTTTIPTTTTARTTTTTTTTPRPRVSSEIKSKLSSIVRGGSRFQPSAETSANRGETKTNRNRPTLKPVSKLAPSKAEPIDIFKHPPRRLEPIFAQPIPDVTAAKCEEEICRLPDCFCGGKQVPGGLKLKDLPQIVLLTFDDSVNDLNKELYQDLFEQERFNPNGCPISATFYVSHEWTDYGQVQNLYADGHEIASHTISHSFGEQFSAKKWAKEAAGQRDVLATYGGVRLEDVRGLRAPFLSVGGNRMFKMLYDMNFTYDSSMPVYENTPPSWPYTLDYKIFHDCMIPPCPTKSYPGVWEVPMVMWQDLNGGRCSMGDGCSNPPDAEGVYKMLIKNFERHYTTNRAPFPLYYHSAWFTTVHHKEGFMAFLDTIVAMDNVWLTTNWQAIQWMRDPTPLDRIKSFKPFQCDYPERPKKCKSAKVCNAWHKSGVRYMRTCQPCPEVFPWTGKTGIKNVELDNYID